MLSSILRVLNCRIDKEKTMYEKEIVDEQAKVDKMIAEGRDEYDIRKQVIASTSTQVVPIATDI